MGERESGRSHRKACALPDAGGHSRARASVTGRMEGAFVGAYKRGGERGVREGVAQKEGTFRGERMREMVAVREGVSRRGQVRTSIEWNKSGRAFVVFHKFGSDFRTQ